MKMYKMIFSSSMGNAIEFLSLILYSGTSVSLAEEFFPGAYTQSLAAMSAFCVSYIARPLGAWVLGFLGDMKGRNSVLKLTIWGIGVVNVCMVFLPGYQVLGVWSVVLFLLLRLLQGFCVGAEYSGAMVFVLESVPHPLKGWAGGIVSSSCFWGIGLGTILVRWGLPLFGANGWRYGFLCAGVLSFVAVFLRRNNEETEEFHNMNVKDNKGGWRRFWQVFCAACCDGMSTYTLCGFSFVYAVYFCHFAEPVVLIWSLLGVVIASVMSCVAGWCTRYYSVYSLLKKGLLVGVIVYPISFSIVGAMSWGLPIFFILLAILGGWFVGLQPLLGYRVVPAAQRLRVLAPAYNVALGLCGGVMPLVLTWAILKTQSTLLPGLVLGIICILLYIVNARYSEEKEHGR